MDAGQRPHRTRGSRDLLLRLGPQRRQGHIQPPGGAVVEQRLPALSSSMDCIGAARRYCGQRLVLIPPSIHPFMHTFTHRRRCQPCKATASSSGAVRVRCLAQGHLDTLLGGARDQTSNLPVTSQRALPPEPHAALVQGLCVRRLIGCCPHRGIVVLTQETHTRKEDQRNQNKTM